MNATAKTGFLIPAELACKLGELQATADLAADRLRGDSPYLAKILAEWHGIIKSLSASTYYQPVPETVEIEVAS